MGMTIDKSLENDFILCDFCVHRRTVKTCDAFPKGIPESILNGSVQHNKPYPGDNGIQYKKAETPEEVEKAKSIFDKKIKGV